MAQYLRKCCHTVRIGDAPLAVTRLQRHLSSTQRCRLINRKLKALVAAEQSALTTRQSRPLATVSRVAALGGGWDTSQL